MSMLVWTLLGLLVFIPMINGYTVIVTRGIRDSIQTSIRQKPTGSKCDDTGACQCKKNLPNFIFDSTSLAGKCVKDNKIIKDRSKGKLLPGKKKCLGLNRNGNIANLNCNVDRLAVQWIWTIDEQMMNLKTLTCLRGDIILKGRRRVKIKKAFFLERCSINTQEQKWACTQPVSRPLEVTNKGTPNFTLEWINPGDDSYFENCDRHVYSYKGCYLFSDGNHIKLVRDAGCDTHHNGVCRLDLEIQAPIGVAMTSCELDWTTSSYAVSGSYWYPFNETTTEGFQINSTLYPATLQIKNTSYILSRWPGHLLKLGIKCTSKEGKSESHCALLKVQGTATEIHVANNSAPTTSAITTLSTSNITSQPVSSTVFQYQVNTTSIPTWSQKASTTNTSQPGLNSDARKDDEDPSMILPIALAAAAVVCLLIVVVVVLVICRRRRKRMDVTQNEEHIYEEPTFDYNGPASPIYMEIDNVIRSKRKSERSQKRSTSESREEPTDSPLYHTLERQDRVEADKDKEIHEEVEPEETLEDPPTPKVFEKELDV